ncbi:MAG: mechanosensitive ion channel family protein [Bacteroidales bacterium]|jgi:small-conductance mechanosensitive channel|nr:mechanosensitive ion channel family protein [Bacteroidales bacterium]
MFRQTLTQDFWNDIFNTLSEWIVNQMPAILLLIFLLFISLKFINILIRRLRKILIKHATKSPKYNTLEASKRINTLLGILKGLGNIIIWAVFIMTLLKKLGIDVGPILAGAGILGLAIGFGAQELVRDFISGFFILLENQVRAGDYAIINGTDGLIESIELRTITMRDLSGVVHVFQNGKVDRLSNMTKEWSAIILDIGVAYKEDVDHVMRIMQDVGEKMISDQNYKEKILEPLLIMGLNKFDDSAVVIRARLKTIPGEQWALGREYRKRLKKSFDEKGIEIPFPHTTVYWGEKINPLELNVKK